MYERHLKGTIGKAKAVDHFASLGYEVFLPFDDRSVCDLIVLRNGKPLRVSVKYCSVKAKDSAAWVVDLRTISRRNHGAVVTKLFDKYSVDLLAVYIAPEDRVEVIDVSRISGKVSVCIRMDARAVMGRVANP